MILYRKVIVATLFAFAVLSSAANEELPLDRLEKFVIKTEKDYKTPVILTNAAEIDLLTSKKKELIFEIGIADFGGNKILSRKSEDLSILLDLANYNIGMIDAKEWEKKGSRNRKKPTFIRGYVSDVLLMLGTTCNLDIHYGLQYDFNITFYYSGEVSHRDYCEGLIVALSMSGLKLYGEQDKLIIRDRHYDLKKTFKNTKSRINKGNIEY